MPSHMGASTNMCHCHVGCDGWTDPHPRIGAGVPVVIQVNNLEEAGEAVELGASTIIAQVQNQQLWDKCVLLGAKAVGASFYLAFSSGQCCSGDSLIAISPHAATAVTMPVCGGPFLSSLSGDPATAGVCSCAARLRA